MLVLTVIFSATSTWRLPNSMTCWDYSDPESPRL